ncbi:hypothetical protein H1S01_00855 [Heliobacterium chlorum]|uniref:Uncharacterized protein n=1 Tax=Heliobacterium chlorum TaxID=2698 RepID=A0ABR7SZ92_HELCL|nr:hypothetical protein [Heliobacterium chlorum]MBC9783053.1 hypothetical protein [Heliobacterium chlorum]
MGDPNMTMPNLGEDSGAILDDEDLLPQNLSSVKGSTEVVPSAGLHME